MSYILKRLWIQLHIRNNRIMLVKIHCIDVMPGESILISIKHFFWYVPYIWEIPLRSATINCDIFLYMLKHITNQRNNEGIKNRETEKEKEREIIWEYSIRIFSPLINFHIRLINFYSLCSSTRIFQFHSKISVSVQFPSNDYDILYYPSFLNQYFAVYLAILQLQM